MGLATDIKNIGWGRIIQLVCTIILISFLFYGAYRYYFTKPTPVVNNYTAPVTQNHYEIKKVQHLITGLFMGKQEKGWIVGGHISWLW